MSNHFENIKSIRGDMAMAEQSAGQAMEKYQEFVAEHLCAREEETNELLWVIWNLVEALSDRYSPKMAREDAKAILRLFRFHEDRDEIDFLPSKQNLPSRIEKLEAASKDVIASWKAYIDRADLSTDLAIDRLERVLEGKVDE